MDGILVFLLNSSNFVTHGRKIWVTDWLISTLLTLLVRGAQYARIFSEGYFSMKKGSAGSKFHCAPRTQATLKSPALLGLK